MLASLPQTQLIEVLEAALDKRGIPDFQKPFVLQRMKEKASGEPHTLRDIPVDAKTFVEHHSYMNASGALWPGVMPYLEEMCEEDRYDEAVLTGSIGCAKTTLALYITIYQLYRLLLYREPQKFFGLDPASEIIFVFQSLNYSSARDVDFNRFKEMVEESPWFQQHAPPDPKVTSRLVFRNRIEVVPVSGNESAAIGRNVVGGILDELNYMSVVEASNRSVDRGTYDQAIALYNSISRRRSSRFRDKGRLPGMLCLVSSKRYPGQFTDQKQEEARTNPRIYVYDKRTWDIRPENYTGRWFHVFTGDETRRPRILDRGEEVHEEDRHLVMAIPEEDRHEFEKDIINALREIAGVATLATYPFIVQTEAIGRAMAGVNVFNQPETDFDRYKLTIKKEWPTWNALRFAHVDLGLTSDSAGIAIGHVLDFVSTERSEGMVEVMPRIVIDGVLEVRPPAGGEINFEKIRDIFYVIRDKLQIPLKYISYDSYQSVDSLQLLRGKGFVTGNQSMDKTRHAYELTKTALYQDRLILPEHAKLRKELASLENDPLTGKVDHPVHGSKDLADAVAGVVYGLTMRREIWMAHKIPMTLIPSWLSQMGRPDSALERQPLQAVGGN